MTNATPPPLEPHIIETPGPVRARWSCRSGRPHPCACGETDTEPLDHLGGRLADGRHLVPPPRSLSIVRASAPDPLLALHDHYIPITRGFELVATPDPPG
ncbi:MAG: hypothetical protein HS111_28910 [Kofleriaceae bacterium]|nr:hypothetical protein [Kofleriaceae bacterium]